MTGSNVNRLVHGNPRLQPLFNRRRGFTLGSPAADQLQSRGAPLGGMFFHRLRVHGY